jgi:hypothetical protein
MEKMMMTEKTILRMRRMETARILLPQLWTRHLNLNLQ